MNLEQFIEDYYADDIQSLCESYPLERSLWIEYGDLHDYDPELARKFLDRPSSCRSRLQGVVKRYVNDSDDITLVAPDINVRVTDEAGHLDRIEVADISADHLGSYVAVTGKVGKVTEKETLITEIGYSCADCGALNHEPQPRHSTVKPNECEACGDGSYFNVEPDELETVDLRRLKLETPPDTAAQGEGASTTVAVTDDLCDYGGDNGLPDRAGETCTILAKRDFVEEDLFGRNGSPTPRTWLEAHAIVFHKEDNDSVDVDAHMEAIADCLNEDDPITFFRDNIAPTLDLDDDMETVALAAVAWLFGAYRVEQDEGTYRGDIHFGLIGDPGVGKSSLLGELHKIAPQSEFRSGTGLTEVGLTAATVREEFAGESKWTLEPGILPRASGGHCIIDEVDDVLDENSKAIHDALEGQQMVKINKADISADLETRTSLLASGNPKYGRFDRYESVAEQVDLDPALLDRMDILLHLKDKVDEERDRTKARHYLESYKEVSAMERYERGEMDVEPEMHIADRDVPVEVLRAWVAWARQNIFPRLTDEADEMIEDFYIEARNSNGGHDSGSDDEAIPATPRTIAAGVRISTAFARCEGSETVEKRHVERAKEITKQTIGLNFDPATGEFDAGRTDSGGVNKHRQMARAIGNASPDGENTEWDDAVDALVEKFDVTHQKAEHEIEKLKKKGELLEPSTDTLRPT